MTTRARLGAVGSAARGAGAAGVLLGCVLALATAASNGFHAFADVVRLTVALAAVFGALAATAGVVVGLVGALTGNGVATPGERGFTGAVVLVAAVWMARRFEFLSAYPAHWSFVDGFGGMLAVASGFLALLAIGAYVSGRLLAGLAVGLRPLGVTMGRALAGATALALAGAAVLALKPEASVPPAADPRPVVFPNDARVLVVGCDGAEWSAIDALISEGELPTLRALIETGVRAPLETIPGRPSPSLWTTIASSRPPRDTGVSDFYVQHVLGANTPVTAFPRHFGLNAGLLLRDVLGPRAVRVTPVHSGLVRTRRVWEILSSAGVRTGVVNWLVTWPATEGSAEFLVTDRTWAARFAPGAPEASLVPAGIDANAEPSFVGADRLWDPPEVRLCLPDDPAALATEDAFVAKAAMRLWDAYSPQVMMVYFRDVDAAEHLAWDRWEPRFFRGRSGPGRQGPVRDAYLAFDRHLGELLDSVGRDTSVIVVSDHGHGPWFTWLGRGTPGGHTDAPPGIFLAAGPAIAPSSLPLSPTVYDITPTLLHLVGLPAAANMKGNVLRGVLSDTGSLRRVATWESGRSPQVDAPPSMEDEAVMERLRTLGYIR